MTTEVTEPVLDQAAAVAVARWFDVCGYDDLMPERGAAALVEGVQVAIFRTYHGALYALSNLDPFSGAYVMARGIQGTRGGVPTVASPMYKQVFDLRTGQCLHPVGKPLMHLRTYAVRLQDGDVSVGLAAHRDVLPAPGAGGLGS